MTDKAKEEIYKVLGVMLLGLGRKEALAKICAIVDEERKGEGWIKQDEVLEILARHEFPDNIDGVCDQNIELRLIAEEIESLPRHPAAPSQEPLAVLADRKGYAVYTNKRKIKPISHMPWHISLTFIKSTNKRTSFYADTYAAAEAKARAYLERLPDKREER